MGTTRRVNTLRNGAEGVEGEHFKILAGTDNNHSFLNTIGRNPRTFKDYEVASIKTIKFPATMAIELRKKTPDRPRIEYFTKESQL